MALGLASPPPPQCLWLWGVDCGPVFTMGSFKGRPITSLAGRGVEEVLDPLLQVTLALDHIHHHGLVHRDVKPSNILVRPATLATACQASKPSCSTLGRRSITA